MAWKITKNPNAPAAPIHHPGRCMACGHLEKPDGERNESHDPDVGCLVEGGTKFVTNEAGDILGVCACTKFIPSPEAGGSK